MSASFLLLVAARRSRAFVQCAGNFTSRYQAYKYSVKDLLGAFQRSTKAVPAFTIVNQLVYNHFESFVSGLARDTLEVLNKR